MTKTWANTGMYFRICEFFISSLSKQMARRDDAAKKKKELGDKLTPTDETPGYDEI